METQPNTSKVPMDTPEPNIKGGKKKYLLAKVNCKDKRGKKLKAHSQCEKKRRDSILKGYEALQAVIPTCQLASTSGHKLSKAVILQEAINYIKYHVEQKCMEEAKNKKLRREILALQILLCNYEKIALAMSSFQIPGEDAPTDFDRHRILHRILDSLFMSFENIPVNNFTEFSAAVFNWIEQNCMTEKIFSSIKSTLHDHNYIS